MPTVNKLTDHKCRAAKPGDGWIKLFDGHGLFLHLAPTGSKTWRVAYRDDAGKAQTATLGPYPLIGLADARAARDDIRRRLLLGVNVKAKPQKSITFEQACRDYWAGRKDVSAGYLANATRGLAMHLQPDLGKLPIGTITREMVLVPLARLDAAGKHVYARRLRVWAGQVFAWALEHGHCASNPAALIAPEKAFGRKPVEHHASLELRDVAGFMERLALEDALQSVLACRLLALTWVRTNELRAMRWSELEGDVWRVPGPRMKKGRVHLVPLSRQALAILAIQRPRSNGSAYVWPADHRIDRPMSENAVLYLIHRIGYKDRMTGHGWRSVASTWANENGYNRDHIEVQLAHGSDDKVRDAYNHAAYLPQRRTMLQAWADWVLPDPAG